MKKYLLLLLVLALFSCDRRTDFEKKLIDSKWIFSMEPSNSASYYIRFYEDGNYKCFGVFSNIEEEIPTKPLQKWGYLPEEEKLIFFGSEFKVTSVQKDTLIYMVKGSTKYSLYNYPNADGSIVEPLPPLQKGPWRCEGG